MSSLLQHVYKEDGRSLQTETEVPDGDEIDSLNFPPHAILSYKQKQN